MDGTKTVRRRTHDYEFSENSQFRRKRRKEIETDNTNSVEIVGESHAVFVSENAGNEHYWNQDTSSHNAKCFLPDGTFGESGLMANIQNHNNNCGRRFLSSPQNGRCKEKLPNCTVGRTVEMNCLPSLPPSLRESERMLYVQRWINSIPPDLPSWIQVSHNKIIPVTNPHECYAEIEDSIISELPGDASDLASNHDILDCHHGHNLNSISQPMNYYSKLPNNAHSSNPSTQKATSKIPGVSPVGPLQPPPLPPPAPQPHSSSISVQHGNNNTLSVIASKFQNMPSSGTLNCHKNLFTPTLQQNFHLNQEMDLSNHPQQHQYCSDNDHNQLNYSSRDTLLGHNIVDYELNNHNNNNNNNNNSINNSQRHPVGDSLNSSGRLFSDMEIQMIVKLFQDYFTKGSCPMLKEVRRRIMNNFLESRRTPVGIRAKIKRLQKSGQWTDYITA
ncbi:Photosynthetic reaction centre L M [Schistosoma japonicum]|nr:Photosynthetic reaction centre L M [Schistosoma japonicum]